MIQKPHFVLTRSMWRLPETGCKHFGVVKVHLKTLRSHPPGSCNRVMATASRHDIRLTPPLAGCLQLINMEDWPANRICMGLFKWLCSNSSENDCSIYRITRRYQLIPVGATCIRPYDETSTGDLWPQTSTLSRIVSMPMREIASRTNATSALWNYFRRTNIQSSLPWMFLVLFRRPSTEKDSSCF